MKKGLVYAGLVLATTIATTVFQPLSYLGAWAAPPQQAGCQTFRETGKTVCGRFLQYWLQNGDLPQQGYPISNEFREKSDLDGKEYTVQYFERAVFEMHPENPQPYDVLLSQLGTFRFREKYPNGEPGAAPPPPTPIPGVGVKVTLREGVTITLTSQDTGLTNCNGPTMRWNFSIENTSQLDFLINQDKEGTVQIDSTGKQYRFKEYCGGSAGYQAFEGPTALPKGSSAIGQVAMDANVPSTATYLDLKITISGTPLTFRYPLR